MPSLFDDIAREQMQQEYGPDDQSIGACVDCSREITEGDSTARRVTHLPGGAMRCASCANGRYHCRSCGCAVSAPGTCGDALCEDEAMEAVDATTPPAVSRDA